MCRIKIVSELCFALYVKEALKEPGGNRLIISSCTLTLHLLINSSFLVKFIQLAVPSRASIWIHKRPMDRLQVSATSEMTCKI